MHLSMVSPRVGGGGGWATHGKLTQRAFPWAGILTQSWEFDMPATLEDLENLEMTYIVFASWYWKDFSFSRGVVLLGILGTLFWPKSVIFQTRPLGRNYVSII